MDFSKYEIKNIFPDRLAEFKSLYEKQSKRKDVTSDNYVIEDALNGKYKALMGDTLDAKVISDYSGGLKIMIYMII